jgi:hypothetical protein
VAHCQGGCCGRDGGSLRSHAQPRAGCLASEVKASRQHAPVASTGQPSRSRYWLRVALRMMHLCCRCSATDIDDAEMKDEPVPPPLQDSTTTQLEKLQHQIGQLAAAQEEMTVPAGSAQACQEDELDHDGFVLAQPTLIIIPLRLAAPLLLCLVPRSVSRSA